MSEIQLLDIDLKKTREKSADNINTKFTATGGGQYFIPAGKECDSIELINYIKYDEYGNMQFVDFRIKSFFKGGAENG